MTGNNNLATIKFTINSLSKLMVHGPYMKYDSVCIRTSPVPGHMFKYVIDWIGVTVFYKQC